MKLSPVGQFDGDITRTLDHMGVSEHQPVRADDETRTQAMGGHIARRLRACARNAELPEELVERIIWVQMGHRALVGRGLFVIIIVTVATGVVGGAGHTDVDHGRAVLCGDLRKAGQRRAG